MMSRPYYGEGEEPPKHFSPDQYCVSSDGQHHIVCKLAVHRGVCGQTVTKSTKVCTHLGQGCR
jgi:hypothetical protein